MAAIPKMLAETGRRSSSQSRMSHGRGGAGNIGVTKTEFDPNSLETPTLKSSMYTTGRGGSGNMAKNDSAADARKAQDVTAKPRRDSASSAHVGRGGAANVFKPTEEEIAAAKKENEKWESAIAEEVKNGKHEKGIAEKGKDWLLRKK